MRLERFFKPHNPGRQGWPTIRYYNQVTGYGGADYEKLTFDKIHDELRDVKNMKNYVNSAGTTTLCDVVTEDNCTEKESKYIRPWKALSKWKRKSNILAALRKELDLLIDLSIDASSLDGLQKQWVGQRQGLLKALHLAIDRPANAEL